jgi:hypothetical protein
VLLNRNRFPWKRFTSVNLLDRDVPSFYKNTNSSMIFDASFLREGGSLCKK